MIAIYSVRPSLCAETLQWHPLYTHGSKLCYINSIAWKVDSSQCYRNPTTQCLQELSSSLIARWKYVLSSRPKTRRSLRQSKSKHCDICQSGVYSVIAKQNSSILYLVLVYLLIQHALVRTKHLMCHFAYIANVSLQCSTSLYKI